MWVYESNDRWRKYTRISFVYLGLLFHHTSVGLVYIRRLAKLWAVLIVLIIHDIRQ